MSDYVTFISIVNFFLWMYFVYVQLYNDTQREVRQKWYDDINNGISFKLPKWIFFPAWLILYGLMTFSIFFYWNSPSERQYFIVVVILFSINVLINKLWSLVFFGMQDFFMAFALSIILLITAVIVLIYMGLDGAWVSFGLYAAYPIWLFIAMILAAEFYSYDNGRAHRKLQMHS